MDRKIYGIGEEWIGGNQKGSNRIRTCFVLFLHTGNPRELSMSGNCVGLGLNCNLWKKESIDEFYRQGIGRSYKW